MAKHKLTYESFTRYEEDQAVIDRLVSKGWQNHGVPTPPAPDPDLVARRRVHLIKMKARDLILSQLPEWKQRNLSARFTELLEKQVSGKTLSTEESSEMVGIKGWWTWVKEVRSESDRLEADTDLYIEDASWPEVPQ